MIKKHLFVLVIAVTFCSTGFSQPESHNAALRISLFERALNSALDITTATRHKIRATQDGLTDI